MKTQKQISNVINSIIINQVDIIIVTRITIKDFNFPKLTLDEVIDTDFTLYSADLRVKEKLFKFFIKLVTDPKERVKNLVYIYEHTLKKSNFYEKICKK